MERMKQTALSLIVSLLAANVLHVENWPGWRGPGGRGISSESSFPVSWDATNIRWKTPIPGRGHSSPIVWEDRIFLTTSIEGDVVPGRETKPEHKFDGQPFIHPDMISHDRRQTIIRTVPVFM